ncbi:hypothetical protein ACFL5P_02815, partial [candidate division KSB1 bacterium]
KPTAEPEGLISAHDFFAGITYSQAVNDKLYFGCTAKYLYQKIYIHSSKGFSMDAGLNYLINEEGLSFGIVLQNMGTMSSMNNESPELPKLAQFGLSYLLPKFSESDNETYVSLSYETLFEGKNRFHFGGEYRYMKKYSLRAGYISGFDQRDISIGTGLIYEHIGFDYAYIPNVTTFGNQHIFSLRIKIQ